MKMTTPLWMQRAPDRISYNLNLAFLISSHYDRSVRRMRSGVTCISLAPFASLQ